MISQASLNKAYSYMLAPTTSASTTQTAKAADSGSAGLSQTASTTKLGEPVTISSEGRAALEKSQSAWAAIANNPDPNISVQQYAIPEWYAAGLVDTATLPGSPGYSANDTSNSSKIMAADGGVRNEYFKLIESHFNKIKSANGINTQEDYYNAMIADSAKSENLHQQFKESVSSDTRLTELMQKMGVSL